MEFSSAIYRGDPCPELSFSFKSQKGMERIVIAYHFTSVYVSL